MLLPKLSVFAFGFELIDPTFLGLLEEVDGQFVVGCVLVNQGGLDQGSDLVGSFWWEVNFLDDAGCDTWVALCAPDIQWENVLCQRFPGIIANSNTTRKTTMTPPPTSNVFPQTA